MKMPKLKQIAVQNISLIHFKLILPLDTPENIIKIQIKNTKIDPFHVIGLFLYPLNTP